MTSKRLLIVGASGFVGANFVLAAREQYRVTAHSSRKPVRADGVGSAIADLRSPGSAARLVRDAKADIVINCAALADLQACENDPKLARRLNAGVPDEIAERCRLDGAAFVHISTDAVFGDGTPPWTALSVPQPINVYGATKAEGEERVLSHLSSGLVVRTNVVGWSPTGRRSLLEFFYNRLSSGERTCGFTDVMFRPLAVCDLWLLLEQLIASSTRGIWHATGADLISKLSFGVMIARTFELDEALLVPHKLAEAGLAVQRPLCADVEPSRAVNGRAVAPPTIVDGLRRLRQQDVRGHRQALSALLSAPVG